MLVAFEQDESHNLGMRATENKKAETFHFINEKTEAQNK